MAQLQNSKVGNICIGVIPGNGVDTTRMSTNGTGTGYRKTAIGGYTLQVNSNSDNTAIGFGASRYSTGRFNTAVGSNSLVVGGGSCNVAIGSFALYNSSASGNENVAVGYKALCYATSASWNVSLGYRSAVSLQTGSKNTIIGPYSNVGAGNDCWNVAVGFCATVSGGGGGRGNVAIGRNALAIGYYSISIGVNTYSVNSVFWGGPQNNTVNCIYGTWAFNSDCRDKTDIVELDDNLGINLVRKLKPVSYRYDNRKLYTIKCNYEFGTKDGTLKVDKKSYGFLAQEIEDASKELNVKYDAVKYDSNRDAYSFAYGELIATMVKTIKTIDERIKTLKTKI